MQEKALKAEYEISFLDDIKFEPRTFVGKIKHWFNFVVSKKYRKDYRYFKVNLEISEILADEIREEINRDIIKQIKDIQGSSPGERRISTQTDEGSTPSGPTKINSIVNTNLIVE